MKGKMGRIIRKMYEKVEGAVVGQEGLSEWFVLGRGVRQGGVLSPLLYSLYVNGIVKELRESGLGVVVTGSTGESIWVGCWLYADDVVLMAKDEVEMQKMLRVVEGFAKKWRFRLSVAKSKVVKFGRKRGGEVGGACELYGKSLEVMEGFKYLGIELERWNRWKVVAERVLEKARMKHGWLIGQMTKRRWKVSAKLRKRVWEGSIRPILEYGVEVWEPAKVLAKKYEQLMCKGGRMVLGVGKCTASLFVRGELGWVSMEARRNVKLMKWVGKLERMDGCRLLSKLYWSGKEEWLRGGRKCSKWWNRVERVCREWGLYDKWVAGEVGLLEETEWVRRVKKKMIKTESSKWRRELEECSKKGGKLELYGKVKEEWGMEKYLLEGRSWRGMNLKSKLRSGTCELEEEMGRGRVQRVERLCRLCGIEVGSVSHFVVRCGPLESCRRRWWEELLCKVEKENGGKNVVDNLQKWKGEGWHELVTVLLLGGLRGWDQ